MIEINKTILAASLLIAATAWQPACAQQPYDMSARIDDAQQLLKASAAYQASAEKLHRRMQDTIRVAQVLKGQATDLEIKVDQTKLSPHLTGAQLKAAQAQYASDLKEFATHATAYAAHADQFHTTVGECNANKTQYEADVQRYQLHTNVFHIPLPNIRPPHICGMLNFSQGQMAHTANQLANDEARVLQSEQQLGVAEDQLKTKIALLPGAQQQVLNENKRALGEQQLTQEFAHLKQEYDILIVEHQALVGKNLSGTIASQTVHGTVSGTKSK